MREQQSYEVFLKAARRVGLVDDFARACHAYGVTLEDAHGPRRTKARTLARAACWRIMRERGQSYPEIGEFWGRDNSTIMAALKKKPKVETAAGDSTGED